MADRSDREQGQPNRCPRRQSLMNRRQSLMTEWDLVRGLHQGQQSQLTASTGWTEDCTRPMLLRQFNPCPQKTYPRSGDGILAAQPSNLIGAKSTIKTITETAQPMSEV